MLIIVHKKYPLFKNLALPFFKGGLYVLGHVSRGELSECKHDPVGRELPDWLALVDHLKVRTISSSRIRIT